MILIPAIDIKDKKCVRLYKGDFNKKKIYSDSPKDIALKWESYGASLIHLVDLDGALDGKSSNYDVIKDISSSVKCDLQIGGGIRNIETIDSYLKLGIKRVILGTSAFKDPNFLKEALKKYPHNISVGLDIKEGKVAIQGWNQKMQVTLKDALAKLPKELSLIILTSVDRDGTLEGFNIDLVNEYLKYSSIPLVVSGGVRSEDDLKIIKNMENEKIFGVILGKSLYEEKLNLKKCIIVYQDAS